MEYPTIRREKPELRTEIIAVAAQIRISKSQQNQEADCAAGLALLASESTQMAIPKSVKTETG